MAAAAGPASAAGTAVGPAGERASVPVAVTVAPGLVPMVVVVVPGRGPGFTHAVAITVRPMATATARPPDRLLIPAPPSHRPTPPGADHHAAMVAPSRRSRRAVCRFIGTVSERAA